MMKIRIFRLPSNWVSFNWYGPTGDVVQKPLNKCNLTNQGEIDADDQMLQCRPIVLVEGINPQLIIKFEQITMYGPSGSNWSYIHCHQESQEDKQQLDRFKHYELDDIKYRRNNVNTED